MFERSYKERMHLIYRLNCSYPGKKPFYFNEITHMTEILFLNGRQTVFAVFTTPKYALIKIK